MKIVKFKANTMPEAIEKIKKDLGPNAVILNSKETKQGGLFGVFKKRQVEVLAAIDPSPVPKKKTKSIPLKQEKQNNVVELNQKMSNKDLSKDSNDEHQKVLAEIKYVKELLLTNSFQSDQPFTANYAIVYNYLLTQEIDEEIAKNIVESISKKYENDELLPEQILPFVKNEIISLLADVSFTGISNKAQIIQFVGPTGVGKTTTLAKLAANSVLKDKKKIAFITMDTYRIAAIDQLKTYAKILNVPIEVAYSIAEYKEALNKFSNYDHIFVDTAGRNFRDMQYVHELKNMLHVENFNTVTYLVLSLAAREKDVTAIYNQFIDFPIEKIIFTKLDETSTYGTILNMCVNNKKGIAYITNGQDVPNDIISPDEQFISELIISRYGHERSS